MSEHITHLDYTKQFATIPAMTPTGAPCPMCDGELYEHPGGRLYGCNTCGHLFSKNELLCIADEMLIDVPTDSDMMALHEHVAVCLTDEAHIRGASAAEIVDGVSSPKWWDTQEEQEL